MLVGRLSYLIVLIALAMPCFAEISVNPERYEITEAESGIPYKIIVTIINQNLFRQDFFIAMSAGSDYLADYAEAEPRTFVLEPNEKINMIVTLDIPDGFSPGLHEIQYDIMSNSGKQGDFRLLFKVPGVVSRNLTIESIKVSSGEAGTHYFTFNVSSQGNSIARGYPILEIYRNGRLVQSFGNETSISVMPRESYSFTLMRDLSGLLPAEYTYNAWIIYDKMATNEFRGRFIITAPENADEAEQVARGEDLIISADLKNPLGRLSFYKISYNIEGQNISGSVEGEIHEAEKHVDLALKTAGLAEGEYRATVETAWGEQLENSAVRAIRITVQRESRQSWLIWLIPAGIIFLGSLAFIFLPRKRRSTAGHDLEALKAAYARIEVQTKQFSTEIYTFLDDSNRWLEAHGYTHQFK